MDISATSHYLLPTGLRDLLPPDARYQTHILHTLLFRFERMGYAQVMPPLAEHEQTLLAGKAKALETNTFRMMDPVDGQMLAIRSDMTTQVSRIAESRLSHAPLPLRLSYAGNVLRTGAQGLSSDRQFTQAGLELIGSDAPEADAEVIAVLLEALDALGFGGLVIDLNAAGLLDAVLAGETTPYDRESIAAALRHKDPTALPGDLACRDALVTLLEASGAPAQVQRALDALALPDPARALIDQLFALAECLPLPAGAVLTMDPIEQAGFDYHHGACFSLFHTESRQEIGRGGRYSLTHQGAPCPATGATLYVGRLLASYQPGEQPERVFIPYGTPLQQTRALRDDGQVTLCALAPAADETEQARKLGCTHRWVNGRLESIT